ncbi:hypothetical protein ACM66B_002276 [Microbotryomycetes sp. NB124-2]
MPRSTRSGSVSSSGASSLASTTPSTPPSEASHTMSPWSKSQELVPVPSRRQASAASGGAESATATAAIKSNTNTPTKQASSSKHSQQQQQQQQSEQQQQQLQDQQTRYNAKYSTRLAKRPKRLSRVRQWFIYWESTSVLSMLEPWEKAFVYLVLVLLFSFAYWAIKNYLPAHVRAITSRAVYYVRGSEGLLAKPLPVAQI